MLKKVLEKALIPVRKYQIKKKNVVLLRNVKINKYTEFEGLSKVYNNTQINNTSIGLGSYIGWNSILNNCKIGRYCSIAPFVEIIYGRHPVNDFISTHPAFFSLKKQAGFTFVTEQTYKEHNLVEGKYSAVIGNDVWIGYGATIVEGKIIGDGAIIGAKSVVTKDIEPYSINVGVPAKKIGYRFEPDIIKRLQDSKWWDKDFEWILKNHEVLLSPY